MQTISQPKRIQRSRRKGTKLPDGVIYVGRPTMWGNPFAIKGIGHARSVILHREWLAGRIGALTLEQSLKFCPSQIDALGRLRERVLSNLFRLSGKDLACWCPLTSEWCHAETLLHLATEYAQIEAAVSSIEHLHGRAA